ncbi:MAG: hypothetical protein JO073_14975 [Actinobacteria bacterium]|nr:hypothetical protein [Actinomycetota bacterium]
MKEPLLRKPPRNSGKAAGGAVAVGGFGLAKTGLLGKFFIWWFVWHGTFGIWRVFGFAGLAVVLVAIAAYFVLRARQ